MGGRYALSLFLSASPRLRGCLNCRNLKVVLVLLLDSSEQEHEYKAKKRVNGGFAAVGIEWVTKVTLQSWYCLPSSHCRRRQSVQLSRPSP